MTGRRIKRLPSRLDVNNIQQLLKCPHLLAHVVLLHVNTCIVNAAVVSATINMDVLGPGKICFLVFSRTISVYLFRFHVTGFTTFSHCCLYSQITPLKSHNVVLQMLPLNKVKTTKKLKLKYSFDEQHIFIKVLVIV